MFSVTQIRFANALKKIILLFYKERGKDGRV